AALARLLRARRGPARGEGLARLRVDRAALGEVGGRALRAGAAPQRPVPRVEQGRRARATARSPGAVPGAVAGGAVKTAAELERAREDVLDRIRLLQRQARA